MNKNKNKATQSLPHSTYLSNRKKPSDNHWKVHEDIRLSQWRLSQILLSSQIKLHPKLKRNEMKEKTKLNKFIQKNVSTKTLLKKKSKRLKRAMKILLPIMWVMVQNKRRKRLKGISSEYGNNVIRLCV